MIELEVEGMAHGGEAIARADGRVCFVAGAMPGERITAEVTEDRSSWARARLVEVVEPSPRRVAPPCPHFGPCGGCTWQYGRYEAQLEWKRSIVVGQLTHLGRVAEPDVGPTVATEPYGYRNRMDFSVADGIPALYRAGSHDLEPLGVCLLLEPRLADLFGRLGDLTGVERLTLRAGDDHVLAVVRGSVPAQAGDWGCAVARAGNRGIEARTGDARVHLMVAGITFRVTGTNFFQVNREGAEALVGLVGEMLAPGPGDTLLDAYAGVGLFAATVGAAAGRVLTLEGGRSAVDDLIHNLAGAGVDAAVARGRVERVLADSGEAWDLAVCDPPRRGLGRDGIAAVLSGSPRAIAYVSCDPAALGRDTRLLGEAGYRLERAVPVDLFPQTYHIETVARFARE